MNSTIANNSVAVDNMQAVSTNSDYKMRVLLVEDDRYARIILQKMLQNEGHQVIVAQNGIEALLLLDKERPQLVITDWVMPMMDGVSLCRELRAQDESRNMYIIIETAQESQDKLVEAFEAGADDYLLKPISPKMFHARLKAAQRVIKMQVQLELDRMQLLSYSNELSQANERLLQQVQQDTLTGLHNRRYALERLEQEWALTKLGNRTISCLMVDIDNFKSINDNYGHLEGDEALKLLASCLRNAARPQDVICRFGGDEFLVICPDTDIYEAIKCAERLRLSVEEQRLQLKNGGAIQLTVSIGVAEKKGSITSMEDLLVCSDNNLYAAKKAGRNCSVM